VAQLRERLKNEGFDYERFRRNVRDQMLLERVRDREVQERVKVTDAEIDAWIANEIAARRTEATWEIAQLLVAVPESADAAQRAALKARAEAALARARAGEDFDTLVRTLSDGPKERGGSLGPRPVDRLPDTFVEAVRPLSSGQVAAALVSSGAGFHVLRLVQGPETGLAVTQHRARHILLRPGPNLSSADAAARLAQIKREIESGQRRFEEVAKVVSQDGSAPQGGDLGWAGPGQFVPEFEQVMKALRPGEISDPVPSRFGVHLIKLEERRAVPMGLREQRELARNALREQKSDAAYEEWAKEVRDRAYVERREAPL
jgi:peptidyl-prolyl cis-trans isomerase SurA